MSRSIWIISVACLFVACNQGPEKVSIGPEERAGHGESCRVRSDCHKDLHCINNRCIKAEYNISSTAKECHVVECTTKAHCCRNVVGECNRKCEDNRCVAFQSCETDDDCGNGRCVGGECAECARDSDCPDGQRCTDDNTCERECQTDSNCPLFNECREGDCVQVGCQSDRECILFTGDGEAFCKKTDNPDEVNKCVQPCHNDLECNVRGGAGDGLGGLGGREGRGRGGLGSPPGVPDAGFSASPGASHGNTPPDRRTTPPETVGGDFFVCKNQRCVFAGCKTDRECRVVGGIENTDRPVEAVCGEPGDDVSLPTPTMDEDAGMADGGDDDREPPLFDSGPGPSPDAF